MALLFNNTDNTDFFSFLENRQGDVQHGREYVTTLALRYWQTTAKEKGTIEAQIFQPTPSKEVLSNAFALLQYFVVDL